ARLQLQAELALEAAAAEGGHGEGTRLALSRDPFSAEREVEQRGADGAAQMRPAFAPIQTGEREAAPESLDGADIHSQRSERCGASGRDLVRTGRLAVGVGDPSERR